MNTTLAQALAWARARLHAAGIVSADADAALLAGHALGLSRGEVEARAILGAPEPAGYRELVERRVAREPLQHITGRAPFRQLELAVGPGVFVPRPETELLVQLTLDEVRSWRENGVSHPRVVDLGTGSGAIALAVATEDRATRVDAVELEENAWAWARRNLKGSRVTLLREDFARFVPPHAGQYCVVVSNPPYVPPQEVPRDPEVRDYDPPAALYGGADHGMAVPRIVMATAVRLLRPGGMLVLEHAESQVEAVADALARRGFERIALHHDLTGRPRASSARLPGDGARDGLQQQSLDVWAPRPTVVGDRPGPSPGTGSEGRGQ